MTNSNEPDNLADQAELPEPGLVREFWEFLRFNKKWWLTPIVIVLMLVGLLMVIGGSAAGPFMYPFF